MMDGTVVSVHRVNEKQGSAIRLPIAFFITDTGLSGDYRERKGKSRQVSLIEEESLLLIGKQLGIEIPDGASRRQIVTRGINLNDMIGKMLRVGEIEILVEDVCSPCSRMEATIGAGAKELMKGRGGVHGRIYRMGYVKEGDLVYLVP